MSEPCFSCGGGFAPVGGGATHAYMLSTPACWAAYGEILAREYDDPALFRAAHRLTVDAFAVQHPGDPGERRAVQSFWIHGAALWIVLRMGRDHGEARAALSRLAKRDYPPVPDCGPFAMTHADLLAAPLADHARLAREWAKAALEGCREAHAGFAALAETGLAAAQRGR